MGWAMRMGWGDEDGMVDGGWWMRMAWWMGNEDGWRVWDGNGGGGGCFLAGILRQSVFLY